MARLISDLSPQERNYEERVEVLMQIGAALWNVSVQAGVAELEGAVSEFVRTV